MYWSHENVIWNEAVFEKHCFAACEEKNQLENDLQASILTLRLTSVQIAEMSLKNNIFLD